MSSRRQFLGAASAGAAALAFPPVFSRGRLFAAPTLAGSGDAPGPAHLLPGCGLDPSPAAHRIPDQADVARSSHAPVAVLNCPRDRRARTPAATPIFCSASSDDASGLPRSVSRMVTATDAPASRVDANALAPCVSIDCEGGRVGARRVATGVARARGEGQARSPRTTRSRDPPSTPPSRDRWPRRSPPARPA